MKVKTLDLSTSHTYVAACFFTIVLYFINSSSSIVFSRSLSALASLYFTKMVHLLTSWAFLAICWASSWHLSVTTVCTAYESFSSGIFCPVECIGLSFMPFHGVKLYIASCGFMSAIVLSKLQPFWPRLISAAGDFTCFLSCGLFSYNLCHHLIIIHTTNKLLFSLLSFSLYLQSLPFILRWPIYSSSLLFCCLISLKYCKDGIVSCCA